MFGVDPIGRFSCDELMVSQDVSNPACLRNEVVRFSDIGLNLLMGRHHHIVLYLQIVSKSALSLAAMMSATFGK